MSVTVQWDNAEKTIIYQTFDGRWTWPDFHAVWDEVTTMAKGIDHPIDFIVDMRRSHLIPDQVFRQMRRVGSDTLDARIGLNVIVGANTFVQTFWSLFCRIYGDAARTFKVDFATTPEEAREIIAKNRPAPDSAETA